MKSLLVLGCFVVSIGNIAPAFLVRANFTQLLAQTNPSSQTQTSPLVSAGSTLVRLERYQQESEMEIAGDIPGTSFASVARVNTIVESPNKVNSQITFVSPNGLEGKTYQVISDGSQVWIYNKATNQYSVSVPKQFLQTREGFSIGTLSHFYLTIRSNIGSSNIATNLLANIPEDRLVRYFQRYSQIDLQNVAIEEETIDGQTYKVYDLDVTDRGFKTTAYVNPESTTIERVDLSGTKDGLQLATQETIFERKIPESIPAGTFSFSPPEGAEQVARQITIQPF